MRNSNGWRALLTGIFVIAGIAILLVLVFIIGGKDKTFEKTLQVNAVFTDVAGLAKGSNVWYSGVKIGIVKKVSFVENGVMVTFSIDEDVQQKIRKDTKVKLGSDGLIGNKIVVLYGGSASSPAVESGTTLAVENGLATEEIMATLQNNNKNLLDITNDLKTVSKNLAEGKGTIGKLLSDPSINNGLQAAVGSLNRAGNNVQELTQNLSDFSKKLNKKGYLFNDIVTDTQIVASLRETTDQLNEMTATASTVMHRLDATAAKLNSSKSPAGILLNDETAAANMQLTLANLQAGTKKLDENMEALQHNFLLRGFFKKREKDEAKRIKDSLKNANAVN